MTNFRPETFSQFIKTTKPTWFLKIIWVFALIFLIIIFFSTYQSSLNAFWGYFVFITIGLTIQASFIYSTKYKIYHFGRQAFLELQNENLQIITNTSVLIKGFDIFSKSSFFTPNIKTAIYDFNQADIILSSKSIVLLGKQNLLGSIEFAAPVEIFISKYTTSIAHAKLSDWSENNNKLQIEIEDKNYNNPIKIEFKHNHEGLKKWLISHK